LSSPSRREEAKTAKIQSVESQAQSKPPCGRQLI
jgi:hypothetical protein